MRLDEELRNCEKLMEEEIEVDKTLDRRIQSAREQEQQEVHKVSVKNLASASSKIENLVHDLKKRLTVIIVTHNMQQAARVSDHTAFMYLGETIEHNPTKKNGEIPEWFLSSRNICHKKP